jgi:SAM-dependent methyltransferase
MNKATEVFNRLALDYDRWFEENRAVYKSEVSAVRRFLPHAGEGLEIGVGSGRFAVPCGVKIGVEPAPAMAELARERGITVYEAKAEALPFKDGTFAFCMLITVICFLADPMAALREARRVLKPGGKIIIGMLDRESPLGQVYDAEKSKDEFFREAKFYSAGEVQQWLANLSFINIEACQTVFADPDSSGQIREGHGEGLFVVLAALK